MRNYLLIGVLFSILYCSSAQEKDGDSQSGGIIDFIIEKAQSEEGQKAIQTAKEKLEDKETQEKLKSSLSGNKKK